MLISGKQFSVQNKMFDIFRSGGGNSAPQGSQVPNQQQPNPGAPNPGNIPDPNNAGTRDPNANLNDPSQDPNKKTGDDVNKSPLAEFAGFWDSNPAKDGEPVQPDWNDHNSVVPKMKIDPKRLVESARRIDFSKAINPERVQKALKEGDVGAFNEVMNGALQAAFANQAMTMSKMAEAMFTQFAEKLYTGALPHHFRKHTVNSQIDADLPILSDPAVAPMFESFKAQMQVKYPKASAQEISAMAKKMITNFADAVKGGGKGGKESQTSAGGKGGQNNEEMDWVEFATGSQQ